MVLGSTTAALVRNATHILYLSVSSSLKTSSAMTVAGCSGVPCVVIALVLAVDTIRLLDLLNTTKPKERRPKIQQLKNEMTQAKLHVYPDATKLYGRQYILIGQCRVNKCA